MEVNIKSDIKSVTLELSREEAHYIWTLLAKTNSGPTNMEHMYRKLSTLMEALGEKRMFSLVYNGSCVSMRRNDEDNPKEV